MHIKKITSLFLVLLLCTSFAFAKKSPTAKLLKGQWKLIRETQQGVEVTPKHSKLMVSFTKKGEFTVTAIYEETHRGTYKLIENDTKIVLKDDVSNTEKTLTIKRIDKDHLNLAGFDGGTSVIEMTPASKKSAHLTHKEHLIVNNWHCYESDEQSNIDMVIEFNKDMSYVIIPAGQKTPVASGNWHIDKKGTTLFLDKLDKNSEGEHLELEIIRMATHKLLLKSKGEDGILNHFRDQKLWKKMRK